MSSTDQKRLAELRANRQAAAPTTLLQGVNQTLGGFVDLIATKIHKEWQPEFEKLTRGKVYLGGTGASVEMDFEIEKWRVEKWGYAPKGHILVVADWNQNDSKPALRVAINYNGKSVTVGPFPVGWDTTPRKFFNKNWSWISDEMTRLFPDTQN